MKVPGMVFCSEECLFNFIVCRQNEDLPSWDVGMVPAKIATPRIYYSPALRRSFRSKLESEFAEHIVEQWKIPMMYEVVMIPVGKNKWYVPDFFAPKSNIFLEVKGLWHIGAMNKFIKAQKILGEERLLLIPPEYFSWFNKKR
jgi:predicted nuclease of restriction endonuclease-like RecB superfamily